MLRKVLLMILVTLPLSITCIGLLLLELAARIFLPPPLSFAQTLGGPLRLFDAGIVATYHIEGLYADAKTVTLRITPDRFIAPAGTRPVLFLGGSTTESIYVPEAQRWVALVGGFNAGQSGSNILDETGVFNYLTARGDRFETVVLSTMINDFGWYQHLGTLNPDGYLARQTAYWERNDATPWWAKISRIGQEVYALQQPASVVQAYVERKRQDEAGRHVVALADCPDVTDLIPPWTIEETTAMKRLKAAVAATGTRLIAMTETTGYRAPTSSFTADIREAFLCGSEGMLSASDTEAIFDVTDQGYLQAARDAGLDTFDLGSQMTPYSDGTDGGRFTYDGTHLTPAGSQLVAQFVNDYLTTTTSSHNSSP